MANSRRDFLKGLGLLGIGSAVLRNETGNAYSLLKPLYEEKSPVPAIGSVINEMEVFKDISTGRTTHKIAWRRDYNQMPTYHLHQAFNREGTKIPVATWNVGEESGLIGFDILSGEGLCLDKTLKGEYGFEGNNVAAHQALNGVMAVRNSGLFFYDWQGKNKIELSEVGQGFYLGHPVASADGKGIVVPKSVPFTAGIDNPLKCLGVDYLYFDLKGTKPKVLFRDLEVRNNHTVPNPKFKTLYLIDRDQPPGFGKGGDGGKISRCWILNTVGNKLIEIRPKDPNRFQIHSNWSHCGRFIYYHGLSGAGRQEGPVTGRNHYIGVADLDGQIIWEKTFPHFWYGHVGTHTTRHALILDGLITDKMLTAIYWKERDSDGNPRMEVLGYHGSDWHKGQMSHPHPQMSRNSKFLAYNSGYDGNRSSVNILKIK